MVQHSTIDHTGITGVGGALTVENEGTPLATAASTLDFVGAGVTASGTGSEKTITIAGTSTPPDCLQSTMTTDVTMGTPNTWTDSGISLSLGAGDWLITGKLLIRVTQTGTDQVAARVCNSDASTVYDAAPMSVPSNNGQEILVPINVRITLGSTTTVKVQGIAIVRTAVIVADPADAAVADNITSRMQATKVTAV